MCWTMAVDTEAARWQRVTRELVLREEPTKGSAIVAGCTPCTAPRLLVLLVISRICENALLVRLLLVLLVQLVKLVLPLFLLVLLLVLLVQLVLLMVVFLLVQLLVLLLAPLVQLVQLVKLVRLVLPLFLLVVLMVLLLVLLVQLVLLMVLLLMLLVQLVLLMVVFLLLVQLVLLLQMLLVRMARLLLGWRGPQRGGTPRSPAGHALIKILSPAVARVLPCTASPARTRAQNCDQLARRRVGRKDRGAERYGRALKREGHAYRAGRAERYAATCPCRKSVSAT